MVLLAKTAPAVNCAGDVPPTTVGSEVVELVVIKVPVPPAPEYNPNCPAPKVPAPVSIITRFQHVVEEVPVPGIYRVNQAGTVIEAMSAGAPLVRTVMFLADSTSGKP